MVNRSGEADGLPSEVEVVRGDAYDVASTTSLTQGAEAVYQCAQPPYHEWAGRFPRMQAAIMEGTARNDARLVVGDNVYMYGDVGGRPITEDMPYAAHTKKGRIRAQMAEELLAAHRAGKVRMAIGRASDFFGPEELIYDGLWFSAAREGRRVNMLGHLDVPHTFSYVPDFGRVLATLGTRDEALGEVWHVPNAPAVTQGEIVQMISSEVGRPVRTRTANAALVRVLGLVNPSMREIGEMMYEWNRPFVVDGGKFERAFGTSATPLREAIRQTVAWSAQHNSG